MGDAVGGVVGELVGDVVGEAVWEDVGELVEDVGEIVGELVGVARTPQISNPVSFSEPSELQLMGVPTFTISPSGP